MNHSDRRLAWSISPAAPAASNNRLATAGSTSGLLTGTARVDRPPPEFARVDRRSPELGELLREQSDVVDVRSALRCLEPAALRWRLDSGRWQQPCRGILVAHSGPLSAEQVPWVAVLWAGPGALLAGLTAAHADGMSGFDDQRIYPLLPAARQIRKSARPSR